jgi:hypothetical protein
VAAPAIVGQEVGGDAKEIAPTVLLALAGKAGAQEAQVGLLGQVVGKRAVARDPRQVGPQRPRGALVERAEGGGVEPDALGGAGECRGGLPEGDRRGRRRTQISLRASTRPPSRPPAPLSSSPQDRDRK